MISVVICTHNRSSILKHALHCLTEMVIPVGLPWELIIIDNNSSDNTKELLDGFIKSSKLNVKYFFEKRQGISHARNRGIREACGKIIAFTDDDCIVDQFWITSIWREFSLDSSVTGVCGRVELYDKNDKPVSIRTYQQKTVFSSPGHLFSLVMGSNMAFVRQVFDEIGMFDEDFGVGARLASADDSDLLYRVHKKGLKIIYSPDVLVYHNHGRRDDAQIKSIYRSYAKGRGGFYCKHILTGDKNVAFFAACEIFSHIRSMASRALRGKTIDHQKLVLLSVMEGFLHKLLITILPHFLKVRL